jgi:hypothetical protein
MSAGWPTEASGSPSRSSPRAAETRSPPPLHRTPPGAGTFPIVLLNAMQYGGEKFHPHAGGLLGPLLLIVAGVCCGAILIPGLGFAVGRGRAAGVRRRTRRRRPRAAAGAEQRARAMMSELCPYGWHAEITLYEGASLTDGTFGGEPVQAPVALDWHELRPGGEPAVTRRVWAPTVAEALEAMVGDRRTDETLEQIELRASADGVLWDDL